MRADVDVIARRHPRGRVAIATHGDIARLLLGNYLGAPLDSFQRIVIDTASVSVVQMRSGERPHVLLMNEGGGLDRFGPDGATPPWEEPAPR